MEEITATTTWTAIEEENKLCAAMTELGLSQYCHAGMVAYITHGAQLGDFLTALIENDLMLAAVLADEFNVKKFREWSVFLRTNAPRACYGSPLTYKMWCNAGGLEGIKALAEQGEAA